MSNFYAFIWNEIASSRLKILDNLQSRAFIFVPSKSGSTRKVVVVGVLVTPQEVYWHDPIGSTELLKDTHDLSKALCSIYPTLHDFFVKECGVTEIPPLRSYLQFLLHLSTVALPLYAGHIVFQVFKLWAEGLESGLLSSEDYEYLKDNICKQEFLLLPTVQDKWVSLHVSFGLVCWSDDESLSMEFKHVHGIHFLHLGELSEVEQQILHGKVLILMRTLGIHALSEIVTREAIYFGRAESSIKTSVVKWALPYAQRYVYTVYPYKYAELKQSGFQNLNRLKIVVVNKLLYRNVIKRSQIASAKHYECNCLLQGDIFYTTQSSDTHSMFVELSRFLIGVPELHLANFLHMIRTMTELGSTTEQTELFIVDSQKVPKLLDEEPIWSLQSTNNEENSTTGSASRMTFETNTSKQKEKTGTNATSRMTVKPNTSKRKEKTGANANWQPTDPSNTSRFSSANNLKMSVSPTQQMLKTDNVNVARTDPNVFIETNTDGMSGKYADTRPHMVISQKSVMLGNEAHHGTTVMGVSGMNFAHNHHLPSTASPYPSDPRLTFDSVEIVTPSDDLTSSSSNFKERDQLSFGTPTGDQALLKGRQGEFEAFKYFCNIAGEKYVRWVNQIHETGFPYDIFVGDGTGQEYIEVKTTDSPTKNWFTVSIREWEFAVQKGDHFSIARVVLLGNNRVRITRYKNPARLCQKGQLQLALLTPN